MKRSYSGFSLLFKNTCLLKDLSLKRVKMKMLEMGVLKLCRDISMWEGMSEARGFSLPLKWGGLIARAMSLFPLEGPEGRAGVSPRLAVSHLQTGGPGSQGWKRKFMAIQVSDEGPCDGHGWQRGIVKGQNGPFLLPLWPTQPCASCSGRRHGARGRHGLSTQSCLHLFEECMCMSFVHTLCV